MESLLLYKVHYNWRWVVEAALHVLFSSERASDEGPTKIDDSPARRPNRFVQVRSIRELPSHELIAERRLLKKCTLLRLEFLDREITALDSTATKLMNHNDVNIVVWISSSAFESLDAKDALAAAFQSVKNSDAMPPTVLIPWDVSDTRTIHLIGEPSLLKAPLGSAGYGLYFVNSSEEVLSIAKSHAQKAEAEPFFLDSLIKDYGRIPSWSLQKVVKSIRVFGDKRCQIRVYLAMRGTELYMYDTYEVRVPSWDIDLDSALFDRTPVSDLMECGLEEFPVSAGLKSDLESCANTLARPYNMQRNKSHTQRFLLEELPELKELKSAISALVLSAFTSLKSEILRNVQMSEILAADCNLDFNFVQLGVAGVDIMIDSDCRPYIVELNNNPAMPAPGKNMSEAYQLHIKKFVRDLINLGCTLQEDVDHSFCKIW